MATSLRLGEGGRHAPHRRIVQQETAEKPAAKVRNAPPRTAAGTRRKASRPKSAQQIPAYHLIDICFEGIDRDSLIINRRQFPAHMRADLQPSMVVIEDVDLIARSREQMEGGCEEVLLNRLLNEMDGLQENSDVLFVLTTNRPQDLEAALAQRPGRIDQAIEVPLPDEACRDKLVRLYGHGMKLSPALIAEAARRTDGVSAAFIKELMRRTAQSALSRAGARKAPEPPTRQGVQPTAADLGEALDDMLFSGGKLNVKLLGGAEH